MSREIVFIAGSPSTTSRSSFVARVVAGHAERAGFILRSFSLRDFAPADVLLANAEAAEVKAFVEAVKGASALVLSSPVYKATYAGGLKAIVDLIPPDAIAGRPALGIATTRQAAHGPEVERAYRSLFAFFRASVVDPLIALDEEIPTTGGEASLSEPARQRVEAAASALVSLALRA